MPDHLGLRQFAIERVVVVLGAVADVEPIGLWRNEVQHLGAGREMGQHPHRRALARGVSSYRHRFAIHLAIVSAFSLRAPGVVK